MFGIKNRTKVMKRKLIFTVSPNTTTRISKLSSNKLKQDNVLSMYIIYYIFHMELNCGTVKKLEL